MLYIVAYIIGFDVYLFRYKYVDVKLVTLQLKCYKLHCIVLNVMEECFITDSLFRFVCNEQFVVKSL